MKGIIIDWEEHRIQCTNEVWYIADGFRKVRYPKTNEEKERGPCYIDFSKPQIANINEHTVCYLIANM